MVCDIILKNNKTLNYLLMQKLMNKITQVGNTLEKNSENTDNYRILFERIHYTIKTWI